MMKRSEPNRRLNIWVARSIPVFLLAIIGYVSWVITRVICIDYLINTPESLDYHTQRGAAVAILTTYYLVLLVLLTTYGRLLEVVGRHPGLVPRGAQWHEEKSQQINNSTLRLHEHSSTDEKDTRIGNASRTKTSPFESSVHQEAGHLRAEEFWKRDIFTCKYDGRPDFCSTCQNWKPDRAHHCSELDRCVLKMDHFCPWVGGVVGETSFKFFIQFTFYGAIYCVHMIIVDAYFFNQRKNVEGKINVHMLVTLALAAFFFLFTAGMCLSSAQFAFINSTTIENLSRKRKVWCLAIYIPPPILEQLEGMGHQLRLITYPRPPEEQLQMFRPQESGASQVSTNTVENPSNLPSIGEQRTFGIFEAYPGANPWDLGSLGNFKQIMGENVWEWFTPVHTSPCTRHESFESFYKLGPLVQRIKEQAGIMPSPEHEKRRSRGSRRKHQKHSSPSLEGSAA